MIESPIFIVTSSQNLRSNSETMEKGKKCPTRVEDI
jgi:hypothetical protein